MSWGTTMDRARMLVLALALAWPAADAAAQRTPAGGECRAGETRGGIGSGRPADSQGYDVVLNVPALCVDRLRLRVDDLDARISLDARVANLVRVSAGADVELGTLDLGIEGVRARALLLIDLENVVQVVDRVLGFIDAHPEIVDQLAGTVEGLAGTVGSVAGSALAPGGALSETVNTLGQTVRTTLDGAGNLVETTVDTAGNVVGSRTLGALTDLPVVGETRDAAGSLVRSARLPGGGLVEYTLDAAGRVTGVRGGGAAAPR